MPCAKHCAGTVGGEVNQAGVVPLLWSFRISGKNRDVKQIMSTVFRENRLRGFP